MGNPNREPCIRQRRVGMEVRDVKVEEGRRGKEGWAWADKLEAVEDCEEAKVGRRDDNMNKHAGWAEWNNK